jgi:hypothetical protein
MKKLKGPGRRPDGQATPLRRCGASQQGSTVSPHPCQWPGEDMNLYRRPPCAEIDGGALLRSSRRFACSDAGWAPGRSYAGGVF